MTGTLNLKTLRSSSGFTLLEVMVAVAIIAIALVAALGSQSQGVSLATEAKFITTSVFLAQGKMAEFEIMEPDDLGSESGDFGEDFPGYRWEVEIDDVDFDTNKDYRWKAEVGYVSNGKVGGEQSAASEYLKKIELTVYWGDQGRYKYGLVYHRFVQKEGD